MSFKIVDATAPDALKISFSARHNHSNVQKDQLELVRKHKILLGPWVSECADTEVFATRSHEEALDYMSGRIPTKNAKNAANQIKAFLEMPTGSFGVIVSKESGSYETLVVRITDDKIMAGEITALRATRGADGKHSRIALAENLPHGEKFFALSRKVELLGELSHAEVQVWAQEQIAKLKPEESAVSYKGDNPYVLFIATAKSFDTTRKLWLAAPLPVVAPLPVLDLLVDRFVVL